jgi:plastocyanin domain-containing protein
MNFIAASIGAMLFLAQVGGEPSMPMQPSTTNRSFQPIEQPLPVKIGVVLGGLTLVGVELWWFLGRKQQKRQATQSNGVQEVIITVDGGYRPDRVVVVAGQPVKLSFDRHDSNSCLDELLIPDFGISAHLPMDRTTTVEFSPTKIGEYAFTCGMRMFRGVIEVKKGDVS